MPRTTSLDRSSSSTAADRSPEELMDIRPWLRHYDYWVPPRMTYPGRPLTDILDATVVEVPDARATVFLGAELTFGEIKRRSDRFATALARLGIGQGDRVGIMLPNCPQYMIAAFAVLRLGAIVVNVNPTYTAREVQEVAVDSGMLAVLTLDRLAPLWAEVRARTSVEHVIVTALAEYSVDQAPAPRSEGALTLTGLIDEVRERDLPQVSI